MILLKQDNHFKLLVTGIWLRVAREETENKQKIAKFE